MYYFRKMREKFSLYFFLGFLWQIDKWIVYSFSLSSFQFQVRFLSDNVWWALIDDLSEIISALFLFLKWQSPSLNSLFYSVSLSLSPTLCNFMFYVHFGKTKFSLFFSYVRWQKIHSYLEQTVRRFIIKVWHLPAGKQY